MSTVKDRVCNLERTLEEYIKNVGNSQMQTEENSVRLSRKCTSSKRRWGRIEKDIQEMGRNCQ